MAKIPSIGLIVVPQPLISMARISGRNTSVDARHCNCPLVFCDVNERYRSTRGHLSCITGRRDATAAVQGYRAARPSIQGLSVDSGNVTEGELRLQAILNTMSVFVLAQNQANIPPRPLPFNEASTVKLEFWVKNRPKSQDTSAFRLEVAKP